MEPGPPSPFISYAQNREDVLLWRALKGIPQGFYVDVGAQDPVGDSVTKAFYDRGWSGINIEPEPSGFRRLREGRPRDLCLNLAVSTSSGTQTFWCVENQGLSTLDPVLASGYKSQGMAVREIEVETRPLSQILAEHAPGEIHFLKVDAEGHEKPVLESCGFARHRPWIVLAEATVPNAASPRHGDWEALLLENRYRFVHFDGVNRFYLAEEHARLESHFSHPPCFLDGFRPFPEVRLEEDCQAGLKTAERLARLLEEAEADRANRLRAMEELQRLLDASEKDRADRLQAMEELDRLLRKSEEEKASLRAALAAR